MTPEEIKEVLRLRADGLSLREVAKEVKRSFSAVQGVVKRYGADPSKIPASKAAPPDEEAIDVLVDDTEIDNSIRVVRRGKELHNADDLARRAGLDQLTWIAKTFTTGTWQGFYKLKNHLPEKLLSRVIKAAKQGKTLKQIKKLLGDAQYGHRKVHLTTSKATYHHIMHEDVEETWKRWVKKHGGKPLPKQRRKKPARSKLWVNYGYYDTHVGAYAYAKEVGSNYDVEIAVTRVLNSIDDMILKLKALGPIHSVFVPVGNDLGHFDSVRMTTAMGDHRLDIDTRFTWVFDGALTCMAYQVERLCEVANRVKVLYIPGNHDTSLSYGICRAMQQRFMKWPQVYANLEMNPRKYEYFGTCIVGFDHGECKPEKWATTFAAETRGAWDTCTYAEMNNGHTHQPKQMIIPMSTPTNSIYVRVHPSLCPPDSWHHKKQFIGSPLRSVEALYYNERGRIGDLVVHADDTRRRDVNLTVKETLGTKRWKN